jgi:hypothetical protein
VFLNIKKFWLDIPRHYPVTKESLIFRAAQKSSVPLVIYEGKLKNQTFREIMINYQAGEVVFINEKERIFPSPPFLFLNNDGQTDWFQMKALIQKISFCQKNQLVKINDFTHQNWIEAFYCY